MCVPLPCPGGNSQPHSIQIFLKNKILQTLSHALPHVVLCPSGHPRSEVQMDRPVDIFPISTHVCTRLPPDDAQGPLVCPPIMTSFMVPLLWVCIAFKLLFILGMERPLCPGECHFQGVAHRRGNETTTDIITRKQARAGSPPEWARPTHRTRRTD